MDRKVHLCKCTSTYAPGYLLLLLALTCGQSIAQSTVVGGQGVYVYVNGATGSDKQPGSSAEPLKTIQAGVDKALLNNRSGIATVVTVAPGVYRESVSIGSTKTSAPITIEAATAGTVYIDGADLLTNPYESSPGVFAFPWKDSVKGCPLPTGWYTGMPPVVLSNEMLFINGAALTQVMSDSELVPGTFFVNESYHDVEVDPPAGVDPNTAQVEISARRATLTATNSSNLVLSGLTFQHAASCLNEFGANIFSSSNVLLDQVQANWNNWGGLGLSNSSNVTVKNSIASYNGGVGFGASETTNTLYENNEADYNNWRGEMVGLYHWGQGGTKIMHAHAVTVSGQRSYNNGAQGLWFDTDNMNVTINNADLVGNLVSNLQLEANQGPVTLLDSSLCSGGIGANLINTADATLTGNHFYGNGEAIANQNAQIYISGNPGGRIVQNFETGAESNVYTSNTTLDSNTFTDVGSGQFVFNTYLSGNDWAEFIDSVHPSNNLWFDAANTMAFGTPNGKHVNFSGWQSISGDTTSSWQLSTAAAQGCSVPAPSYPDFNVFAHNAAAYVPGYTMSGGTLAIPLQVRSFGFGAVDLSVSGLPAGVSASFNPSSLVSGNSMLTLTASTSVVAQTVPITVFATSGNRVHTITVWADIKPGGTGSKSQTVPTVNWATPSAITYGTRLSSAQLNATASVPGTFVYDPASGTLLPLGTTTLSVTFTPTDTVNYAIATQTVQLVVNAASDFTMTVNPASLTIPAGGSGTATVTISPVGGFSGAVQLTCSGLPANTKCAFAPSSVTPNGAPATTTLTIATDVQTLSMATSPNSTWPGRAVPLGGGVGGLLALCFLPGKKRRSAWRTFLGAVLVLASLSAGVSAIGCGGIVFRDGATSAGTPAGTSTVVVSASSGTPGGTPQNCNLTVTITK